MESFEAMDQILTKLWRNKNTGICMEFFAGAWVASFWCFRTSFNPYNFKRIWYFSLKLSEFIFGFDIYHLSVYFCQHYDWATICKLVSAIMKVMYTRLFFIAESEASIDTIAVCCGIPVSHDSNVLLNGRAMDDFSACSVAISYDQRELEFQRAYWKLMLFIVYKSPSPY